MKLSSPRNAFRAVVLLTTVSSLFQAPLTCGLRCYTCSYHKVDEDDSCLTNPVAQNRITDCDKKFCTLVRQEAVRPREVVSFTRGCEDSPIFLNKVVADSTFKTYFRSCTKDLCNSSDGVGRRDPNVGAANNTVIAGKSGAVATLEVPLAATLLSAIIVLSTTTK